MEIAYVAIAVNDTAAVESAFEQHLRLARADVDFRGARIPAFQVGRTRIVVLQQGSPVLDGDDVKAGVHHVAIACPDPLAAAQASGLCREAPTMLESFDGGRRTFVPPPATNGLLLGYATPLRPCQPTSEVTERIDHLGIVTGDNDASKAVFCDRLGLELESFQTDVEADLALETFTSNKYGVVYHSRPPRPRAGVNSIFVSLGDLELEFLQAFDPGQGLPGYKPEGPGHTRQDSNAIARFLASRGPGLAHIAFKVRDINAVLAAFGRDGRRLLDTVGRPGGRRSLIGFVHPAAMGGVLIHFVQRREI